MTMLNPILEPMSAAQRSGVVDIGDGYVIRAYTEYPAYNNNNNKYHIYGDSTQNGGGVCRDGGDRIDGDKATTTRRKTKKYFIMLSASSTDIFFLYNINDIYIYIFYISAGLFFSIPETYHQGLESRVHRMTGYVGISTLDAEI